MKSNLIDKVYVINLKSCYDRKKHIEQEFARLKIEEYEIFEATDKDSKQVQHIMKTNFVKKFPPCFRCKKNECKCTNNVLIKSQIGNWCSFINVMNDIIKKDHQGLIMICEDDIRFTDDGMDILNKSITNEFLQKYNVHFEKPILIRAGSAFSKNHTLKHEPKLVKKVIMSNPCFICNKYYAESFVKNLHIIDTTSDGFIHSNILSMDNSIQSFTILPQPIYELSCGIFKSFKSEIHPKGIDKEDELRLLNHFQRIEYKDYLEKNPEYHEIFKINNEFNMYIPSSKTDGIFIQLRQTKTWEPNVTEVLLHNLIENNIDTFIDVGANIGYYTLLFAKRNIKTYSFEPNINNYDLLTMNLKLNNFKNSFTYNLGLSDSSNELEFFYNKQKSGHGSFDKKVAKQQNLNLSKIIKVNKLDNFDIQGENIMVKMDVEGGEFNVCMGMLNLLDSKKIKVFCIEISSVFYGKDIEEKIINLLKKYFTNLYIVQLKKRLIEIPNLHQYDLICSN